MLRLWWIVMTLALVGVFVSGQSLGRNYGINIRITQRGLSYAAQKAANDLYDRYRNEQMPELSGKSGRNSYRAWNIKIPSLSRPTFSLRINPGQGVTSSVNISSLRVTGNFYGARRLWLFGKVSKRGTFTIRASQIYLNVAMSARRDPSGKPTVSVRSCSSNIGYFKIDIHAGGFIGWILRLMEGRIGRSIKAKLVPMMCEQVRKLVSQKLNPELRQMKVTTRLQDSRLLLDYSLVRPPTFAYSYIDTTIKGDVTWKGRTTGTPTANRSWPAVPGSSSKMVTIYLTSYVMNALGVLLHNDGSLSYYVSRDMVSSIIGPRLSLNCSNSLCAGTLFPELARQYPDGWLEARLKSKSPPSLTTTTNVITGNFSGTLELYVKRPNGQSIKVATATASLQIPLSLAISNNVLRASVGNPRISVTPGQSNTDGLRNFLYTLQQGFTNLKLNEIGRRGVELPSYRGVRFIGPQIYIRPGIIAVTTNVYYSG